MNPIPAPDIPDDSFDFDIPPEDDALLDAIWERLAKENIPPDAEGKSDKPLDDEKNRAVLYALTMLSNELARQRQLKNQPSKSINYDLLAKAWNEADHPRADNGQFGSGGGGSGGDDKKPTAETADKPAVDKPSTSTSDRPRKQPAPEYSEQAASDLKRSKRTPDDVVKAAGMSDIPADLADKYPPKITTTRYDDGTVLAKVSAGNEKSGFKMERTIKYDKNGNIASVSNDSFFLPKEYQGTGEGTRIFDSQVEALRAQSKKGQYPNIVTTAGKGKNMNGYYTWARMGYDAPVIPKRGWKIPASVTPSGSGGRYNVSDFMKTKDGRDFWKQNGYQETMFFDTNPKALSSRVLDTYVAERKAS